MKILHAADLHLDSPLRGLPETAASTGLGAPGLGARARSATREAFIGLIDLALNEAVSVLLLAGDIFDGAWPDHQTGVFFAQQLSRFTDGGGLVFIARGNHDAENVMSHRVTLPEAVHTFSSAEPETIDLPALGLAVHGWSYPRADTGEDPTPRFPAPVPGRFNIGVLHTNLDGKTGHGNYAPTTQSGLAAKGYSYWALGHIHQREVIKQGGTILCYPGNLQGRHAGELAGAEGKGATLLTIEGGVLAKLEHRPVDVLRWQLVRVDVSQRNNFDEAARAVGDELRLALASAQLPIALRVVLVGRTAAHGALVGQPADLRASISAQLPRHVPVYLEHVKVETEPPPTVGPDPLHDHLQRVVDHALGGDRDTMQAALLRDLDGALRRAGDPELTGLPAAMIEGRALDLLLLRARDTLLHRLRG